LEPPLLVPTVLFVLALAVIASERVDRTKVALLGAVLVLLTQTIDQEQAVEAIDFNTIGLLVGMMIMVRLTEQTGVYTWLAIRAGQWSRGRPLAVVLSLAVTTGVLSAFLDNAPTYLVFFELAGGDPNRLMTTLAPTLAAISMGAVYMGAFTYIGNAPNLMVQAIAVEQGVKMPSFFGYIGWSLVFLGPVLLLLSFMSIGPP